jgi:hypothetical protein
VTTAHQEALATLATEIDKDYLRCLGAIVDQLNGTIAKASSTMSRQQLVRELAGLLTDPTYLSWDDNQSKISSGEQIATLAALSAYLLVDKAL